MPPYGVKSLMRHGSRAARYPRKISPAREERQAEAGASFDDGMTFAVRLEFRGDSEFYANIPAGALLVGKDISQEYSFKHPQVNQPGTLTVRYIPVKKRP